MNLAVIVPTITGREESLQRTMDAYRETLRERAEQYDFDWEIVTPKDLPCWPAGCNAGMRQLEEWPDVYHFGADDLVPLHGWLEPALMVLRQDELPAPRVWNFEVGDRRFAPTQEQDGPAGALTRFTRVPTLTAEMVDAIGPWPEIVYYTDVWVSLKADHVRGWKTRVTAGYDFVHHWSQIGRLADEGEAAHKEFNRLCEEFH